MESRVSPLRLFISFLRLGCTAFGGPAMVKYIGDLACSKNPWVSREEFKHGVALVQTIPGATAMQAAAYAGLKAGGGPGALAAYTGFCLPAFGLMVALTFAYQNAMDISVVASCFKGLKVIVVAIVLNAALSFGRKMVKNWRDGALTALAAVAIAAGRSPVFAIVVCAALGLFFYRTDIPAPTADGAETGEKASSELPGEPLKAEGGFGISVRSLLRDEGVRFGLLMTAVILGILLVLFFSSGRLFDLAVMMMKIDFFAYGGGYASLPLMFHEVVEKRHLMEAGVLMDGIALGQVTPGPIVITAAFVGFLLYGLMGAAVGAWAIFTPSFIILLFAAPVFDLFKEDHRFKRAMRGILASFVGLLLAVLYSFVVAISWGPLALVLAAAASAALFFGVDILWVVLGGGLFSALLL